MASPMDPARAPLWRAHVRRWAQLLADTLLPPTCPGCRDHLLGRRWLCGDCRRDFQAAPREFQCLECRAAGEPGLRCERTDHAHARLLAAFRMLAPLDAVIHDFKYRGRDDLGLPLGRLMADAIPIPEGSMVVGLPLHRTRLRERGYNQADLLARGASRRWGAPVVGEVLRRVRSTLPQARLDHQQRAENVAGVFATPRPDLVQGRSWVLVDDVSTTGATLLAAARVLRDAGAVQVIPVVLAVA